MKEKLQKALVKDFPTLYQDFGGDSRMTCMAFGFEVGDGWEPLIRELSEKLEALDEEVVARQVKEKFGSLRFYIRGGTEAAYDLIAEAEGKSGTTCEECGEPGSIRSPSGRWLSCVCDAHYDERANYEERGNKE